MRKKLISVLVISIVCMAPYLVRAEAERSYEQLSPNGKYVFVMLARGPGEAGVVDELKARYPHSGLYRANFPGKALWGVKWYSSRVHVSSDGIHLVRLGRLHVAAVNGRPNMAQFAVAFYKKGRLTKRYSIGDLIDDTAALVRSGAGFQWHERISFDDVSEKLEVTLMTGQKKVFDTGSGSMILAKANIRKGR